MVKKNTMTDKKGKIGNLLERRKRSESKSTESNDGGGGGGGGGGGDDGSGGETSHLLTRQQSSDKLSKKPKSSSKQSIKASNDKEEPISSSGSNKKHISRKEYLESELETLKKISGMNERLNEQAREIELLKLARKNDEQRISLLEYAVRGLTTTLKQQPEKFGEDDESDHGCMGALW